MELGSVGDSEKFRERCLTCLYGSGVDDGCAGSHCGHNAGAVAATGTAVPLCAPRHSEQDALQVGLPLTSQLLNIWALHDGRHNVQPCWVVCMLVAPPAAIIFAEMGLVYLDQKYLVRTRH